MDRRAFLIRGSLAAAAVGVATTIPGVAQAQGEPKNEKLADAVGDGEGDGATVTMTEPLVVHVRDLASGEIGLYSGTREIVVHDTGLARRLYNAGQ